MELELWSELSAAISAVAVGFGRRKRDRHCTALIVRVHTWAALHDRPVSWACRAENWAAATRPGHLPDQSTMSRRTRRPDFGRFQLLVGRRMNGRPKPALVGVRAVDGKRSRIRRLPGDALELPNHTGDRDATRSRGVGRTAVGYKLHAVRSGNPMPDAFCVTTLNVCEKRMAARMVKRLAGGGYLLADAHYDASWLFDHCHRHGQRLVCPRARPATGLGHCYVSEHRRRAIDMLEAPAGLNRFGPALYARRTDIERDFSGLACFGGGLTTLPPWVRRIWRVRPWVTAKLLINAARIRVNRKKAG